MKKIAIIAIIIIIAASVFVFLRQKKGAVETATNNIPAVETGQSGIVSGGEKSLEIVAQDLFIPWELVFLPDGSMLVSEREGKIRKLGSNPFVISVAEVASIGEGGLLGMTAHPEFSENNWIYLYFTTRTGGTLKNIVARYTFSGTELADKKIIIDSIPAGSNHDGGRITFGPDGFLYVTTGDSGSANLAQDARSLAGKILRVKDDGSVPEDNPFSSPVYSFGHRNVQGITWDGSGRLWATEHGRSGIASGYDELNLIQKGANYGWPEIQGSETRVGMEAPIIHSGANATWAPSGAAYYDGSIFFTGLRGQALYEYDISNNKITEHFEEELGRLREVVIGPDRSFYLLTNNTDGRGSPKSGDDKIIRLSPGFFDEVKSDSSLIKTKDLHLVGSGQLEPGI